MWAVEQAIGPVKVQARAASVQPLFTRSRVRTLRSCPAMSEAPTQVAPGVHRLGNALVNCYLIEDGNRMTLVDGGLPGFRRQLDEYLRSRGRSVADIDAVILTHAHSDHVGIVEGVRTDAPAPVARARARRARWRAPARSTSATAACCPTCVRPARLEALLRRRPHRRRAHAEHRASSPRSPTATSTSPAARA